MTQFILSAILGAATAYACYRLGYRAAFEYGGSLWH